MKVKAGRSGTAKKTAPASTDCFSPRERSRVMRAVRSSGNRATELRLIAILRRWKITGWRRNSALPGRPDFVFPAAHVAVFVDGCFWHGCPRHGERPVQNADYWQRKIARNIQRDRRVTRELRARGWIVVRVWEHSLRGDAAARVAMRLQRAFRKAVTEDTER